MFDSNLQVNISIHLNGSVVTDGKSIRFDYIYIIIFKFITILRILLATAEEGIDQSSRLPVIVTVEGDAPNESQILNVKTIDVPEIEKPREQTPTKAPVTPNMGPFSGIFLPQPGPEMPTADIIKSLIHFLANRPPNTPLWNYEDITAKGYNHAITIRQPYLSN